MVSDEGGATRPLRIMAPPRKGVIQSKEVATECPGIGRLNRLSCALGAIILSADHIVDMQFSHSRSLQEQATPVRGAFTSAVESIPPRPWLKEPTQLSGLDDLPALARAEPELNDFLVKRCWGYLSYLNFHFEVFPIAKFPQTFPANYDAFINSLTPAARTMEAGAERIFSRILLEALNRELLEYRRRSSDCSLWSREMMPTLELKVSFESMKAEGLLEKRGYYLPQGTLAEYLETYQPSREDFLRYRWFEPSEYARVVQWYGTTVLRSSLCHDDPLYKRIEEDVAQFTRDLVTLPDLMRINPGRVAREHPAVHKKAIELFGRFSWAVEECCPVALDSSAVRREAFDAYLAEGHEGAIAVLKDYRVHPALRKKYIGEFARNWASYSGKGSAITTSAFEREVLAEIHACGYFVRTQVPYRELCATDRKFVADMVVALKADAPLVLESQQGQLLIIEVTARGDEFVHGDGYRSRMEQKKVIAQAAGVLLVELTELDPWRDFIATLRGGTDIPEGAYRWLKEKEGRNSPEFFGKAVSNSVEPEKPRFPFWDQDRALARFTARRAR